MPQPATQSKGKLYPAKLLDPETPCPNCRVPVTGFVNSEHIAPVDMGQQFGASDVPVIKNYIVYPCFCAVDAYWAEAFMTEMEARADDKAPHNVHQISERKRQQRRNQLRAMMVSVYARRDAATAAAMPDHRARHERDLCLLAAELQKLTPGDHNSMPPIDMAHSVLLWARKTGRPIPVTNFGESWITLPTITVQNMHARLVIDTEYANRTGQDILSLALAMYRELRDFAAKGSSLSRATIRTLAQLLPDVSSFPARDAEFPDTENKVQDFTVQLAHRRQRRIDVIANKQEQ